MSECILYLPLPKMRFCKSFHAFSSIRFDVSGGKNCDALLNKQWDFRWSNKHKIGGVMRDIMWQITTVYFTHSQNKLIRVNGNSWNLGYINRIFLWLQVVWDEVDVKNVKWLFQSVWLFLNVQTSMSVYYLRKKLWITVVSDPPTDSDLSTWER